MEAGDTAKDMQNNTTLKSITYTGCVGFEIFNSIWLSTSSVLSLLSFVGNLAVILTVYKNKGLRTSTVCFIVNMSVSDILFPLFWLLEYWFALKELGHVSQFAGTLLCKLLPFISEVSYGVSMLSLVVITVYRFSAVMFFMRGRVQNKRKRILIFLTWTIPIAMASSFSVERNFNEQHQTCSYNTFTFHQLRIWWTVRISLFFFLPLLIMLVLYPVILVKLRQHKVPGNANSPQAAIIRRKQNVRLTIMFLIISTAFVLTWGPYIVYILMWFYFRTFLFKIMKQPCAFYHFVITSVIIPVIFHAINPMIYFVFCSSFRKGLKQTFSCCCRSCQQLSIQKNNIQLYIIPQHS